MVFGGRGWLHGGLVMVKTTVWLMFWVVMEVWLVLLQYVGTLCRETICLIGHHFSLLQHETEKLRNDIEKMRSELRYEIDKVTAGQRLDLKLERGRIREELSNQNAEINNLTNKIDRDWC